MFKLGIIEESLEHPEALESVKQYFFSQRVEAIPGDKYPVWHVNEYHVPDEIMVELAEALKWEVKRTWYAHAFSSDRLLVILPGKRFGISLLRDSTWDEMIEYGVSIAQVERHFLENIPLRI